MASLNTAGQCHVCRGCRLLWMMVTQLCVFLAMASAQQCWSGPATGSAKTCVSKIATEMKMMLTYEVDPYTGLMEGQTDSGVLRSNAGVWMYPLMYGSELLVAECCFWGTFSMIPFLDAIGMSKPLAWATAIGANSVASSGAVGFVGLRIFRTRGSKTLALVTTLAGGVANALTYRIYEEDDWDSHEIRNYMLLAVFVPEALWGQISTFYIDIDEQDRVSILRSWLGH